MAAEVAESAPDAVADWVIAFAKAAKLVNPVAADAVEEEALEEEALVEDADADAVVEPATGPD